MHARSTQTGCSSIFRADAVVMSVPLGVLKASVISFHPPLPEWKTQAIHNLGFGLLNKVGVVSLIACFPYLPPCLSPGPCGWCRLCCALSRGSGTHMSTCLATLPRERYPVESCSCSGTSAMPQSSSPSWQVSPHLTP